MEKRAKLTLSAFSTAQYNDLLHSIVFNIFCCKVSLRAAIIQFQKCRCQETVFWRESLLTVEGKFFHYQLNAGKLPLQINSPRKMCSRTNYELFSLHVGQLLQNRLYRFFIYTSDGKRSLSDIISLIMVVIHFLSNYLNIRKSQKRLQEKHFWFIITK